MLRPRVVLYTPNNLQAIDIIEAADGGAPFADAERRRRYRAYSKPRLFAVTARSKCRCSGTAIVSIQPRAMRSAHVVEEVGVDDRGHADRSAP